MVAQRRIKIGDKFNRLTVIEKGGRSNCGLTQYICRCDCGNVVTIPGGHLTSGHTKSCGCLQQEVRSAVHKKHGEAHGHITRLYRIWSNMKTRCYSETDSHFLRWGGRGIKICEEWKEYIPFRDWALSSGYQEDLSIDRINNDGDYEPNNCRWILSKYQARNRRNNTFYEGKCLAEWCEELGIRYGMVNRRMNRGWPIEKALFTPSKRPYRFKPQKE